MARKIICFKCKEHSNYSKEGNCYRCGSDMIAMSGPALRIPKKGSIDWKELTEIYWLQRNKVEKLGGKMEYFVGFGNNSNLHGCRGGVGISMKTREKASLAAIRAYYS